MREKGGGAGERKKERGEEVTCMRSDFYFCINFERIVQLRTSALVEKCVRWEGQELEW